jgi:hypothetical protein
MVARRRSTAVATTAPTATPPATPPPGGAAPAVPTPASVAVAPVAGTTDLVLQWIGFGVVAQRKIMREELGEDLEEFLQITIKELETMGKELSTRSVASRKLTIGLPRMRKLKATIHWAQDRLRIDMPVTIATSINTPEAKATFLAEIADSADRHKIRDNSRDSLETRAKNASPGKLKDESKWDQWEGALIIMLGILQGVNNVPLSYVIREEEHEDGMVYETFIDQCIARASLTGPHFDADSRQVHQLLQSLTNGENASFWLKDLTKKHNGRKDMAALRSHYRGAGNQSRRINAAQKLFNSLHYKNERALKFSQFISQVKNMFNIYEEVQEPYTEAGKLRFLFEKSGSSFLQPTIEVMKAQLGQDDSCWTFVAACDHLASQVPADGGPKVTFQTSAIGSQPGDTKSRIMRNGKIHTGSYSPEDWYEVLTYEERNQVNAARAKEVKGGKKPYKSRRDATSSRKIKSLQKQVKKRDKRISSMQRAPAEEEETSDSESSAELTNAGTKFGGRAEKQRSKKKRKKK